MDTLPPPLLSPPPPRADCCIACSCVTQGTTFTSWQDVFPDVETGGRSEGIMRAAEPPGSLLETGSDDSDDESFKVQYSLMADWLCARTRSESAHPDVSVCPLRRACLIGFCLENCIIVV